MAVATTASREPPALLPLIAHPVRWRLLGELARSDRTVRELTERLDAGQSLVSRSEEHTSELQSR